MKYLYAPGCALMSYKPHIADKLKEIIEKVKDFLSDSTTISNHELVLAIAVVVLGGMVFGLLTSP